MSEHVIKAVLSIAGSDSSGGAGIQADIKTITAYGLYAETVITALTAQNTTGVSGVEETSPSFVAQQLDMVFDDIVPDAVKIGMGSSSEIIKVIASGLERHQARNIVVDPVMISTSGSSLIGDKAIFTLQEALIPLATVITPNMPEAAVLWGSEISGEDEMEQAARDLSTRFGCAVLVKGGHSDKHANDVLVAGGRDGVWFKGRHIDTKNTHGTGCTLSSAIACGLAAGQSIEEAVRGAKEYVTGALEHDLHLGKGNGPLNHMWRG